MTATFRVLVKHLDFIFNIRPKTRKLIPRNLYQKYINVAYILVVIRIPFLELICTLIIYIVIT